MSEVLDKLRAHLEANTRPGDPQALLEAADAFSAENGGMMHLGAEKGAILDRVLDEQKPRRALELGAFFGYSAVRIARKLPDGGVLDTCEPDEAHRAATRWLVDRAGLGARVKIREGLAADLLPGLAEAGEKYDLIFIDHAKEAYLDDLKAIERLGLLAPKGVVVADNVVMFGDTLAAYLEHVRTSDAYTSTLHEVEGDGVEVSIAI